MAGVVNNLRLSKVAKELNVGVHTITDYLAEKGFEIDNKPTTKISEEMYTLLLQKFQSEKKAREESMLLNDNKEEREEITVKNIKDKPKTKKEGDFEDVVLIKNTFFASQQGDEKEEEVKEAPKQKVETPAEPVEEVKEEPKEEVPETEAKEAKEENKIGLKMVGKIDLNKAKTPKEKEPVEEPEVTQPETTPEETTSEAADDTNPPKEETPVVDESKTSDTSPPVKDDSSEEEDQSSEEDKKTIVAKADKLQGPKVVGKIELPVEPKKKPVASSDNVERIKKKRKRKVVANAPTPVDQRGGKGGPGGNKGRGKPDNRKGNKPAVNKEEISDKEIQDKLKETLARLSPGSKAPNIGSIRSRIRKQRKETVAQREQEVQKEQEEQSKTIRVTEFVSASELATLMDVSVGQIISACMSLGMMVSINQRLDAETISIVADEFGFEVEFVSAEIQEAVEEEQDDPEDLEGRAPIVTVMGHVDHGKTSLLDYIRSANVIAGEAGGITQHIGAYEVTLDSGKNITFLDTPGHEAFTAMRARGAKMTDIVIIVIAADDNVMPQTKEAISHAQAAGVPIVFAINKMDKDGANPDRIREELSQMDILVEDWGGKYQSQEISAKTGQNIDQLLEKVLLEAELLELQANPNKLAVGAIVESSLDKGRGIVTTVLVQAGTLTVGDPILAGTHAGKVKAMFDERGHKLRKAGPSTPAVILGFNGAPQAGDKFVVTETEQESKEIANKRSQLQREQGIRTQKHITLDEIGRRLAIGNFKELKVIVKGDVDGSVEALSDSLLKLSTEEIQVSVIHKSVGQISESDVLLASASDAVIIGFQVRPSVQARKLAEQEAIDIRLYSIIYDAIEEIKSAMEGLLAPTIEEKIVCNVVVRDVFKITKVGTVAGCYVTDGKIHRNTKVRVIRDGVVVYTGELASLKRFKEDVKEVATGFECGLNVQNFNDIKVGDVIEGYETVEIKRSL